jgi:hypothetical protein
MSTLKVKETELTPTGTQASFIKESSEKLKAFMESPAREEFELITSREDLPSVVQFGLIHDPRLQIVRAIPVNIRREGVTYVASWDEADEFGYGENRAEALDDFGRTISQLFITLNREKDTLGPSLLETLMLLQKHLRFRVG